MSLFLKNKKQPMAVEELMTELRVMLDKRDRRRHKSRKSTQTNIIDFVAHASNRPEDSIFVEEYQALAKAVADYFFKKDDELTYEDYYYLKQKIAELRKIIKGKAEEK